MQGRGWRQLAAEPELSRAGGEGATVPPVPQRATPAMRRCWLPAVRLACSARPKEKDRVHGFLMS